MPLIMKNSKVHPAFKLNGVALDNHALVKKAHDLFERGMPYEKDVGEFLLQWLNDGTTIQVQTSGSTGTPKRITLKKAQMVRSAEATGAFFNAMEGTRALHCLPSLYIAGKMMLVRAMVLGWELSYVKPGSTPLANTAGTFDFCAMVPLQLSHSLEHLEKVKTVIVGGAPMGLTLKEKVAELPTKIYETYGMTETITHVAVRAVNKSAVKQSMSRSTTNATDQPLVTSYFQALPKVAFSQDNRGCLVISAPGVTANDVVTNDMVRLLSSTAFEWLGRHDNVINSGGIKLIPEQIEAKLAKLITERFFVYGVPDSELGQKMVLFIEGEPNVQGIRKSIEHAGALDKFEMPKAVMGVPLFKETQNGKINRKATVDGRLG